jgi:hypothetical protein
VRDGDIVISTRSKHGTTWLQMICALLVLRTPDLPAPLGVLSPWLDWLVAPRDEVWAQLAAQRHRRFIKSHTPLDGLPLDPGVTYVVGARHPLDAAVSLYHHGDNLDRARMRELTGDGRPIPDDRDKGADEAEGADPPPRRSVREWLLAWIDHEAAAGHRDPGRGVARIGGRHPVRQHARRGRSARARHRRRAPRPRPVLSPGHVRRRPRAAHPGRAGALPRPRRGAGTARPRTVAPPRTACDLTPVAAEPVRGGLGADDAMRSAARGQAPTARPTRSTTSAAQPHDRVTPEPPWP